MLTKDGKPNEADRVLAEFLAGDPITVTLVMMRAQIQAESLKNVDQARDLLLASPTRPRIPPRSCNWPASSSIATSLTPPRASSPRSASRWKEAATGDVLEAQLALKRGHAAEAIEHFDAALKKDPDNKIVQFWKAQLDGQTGAVAEATKSLEAIVREQADQGGRLGHDAHVGGPVGPGQSLAPHR